MGGSDSGAFDDAGVHHDGLEHAACAPTSAIYGQGPRESTIFKYLMNYATRIRVHEFAAESIMGPPRANLSMTFETFAFVVPEG